MRSFCLNLTCFVVGTDSTDIYLVIKYTEVKVHRPIDYLNVHGLHGVISLDIINNIQCIQIRKENVTIQISEDTRNNNILVQITLVCKVYNNHLR